MISESINHKVNFERVAFGVLPIGTGNDFAKTVGWGKYKFWPSPKKLENLAVRLSKSEIGTYDIWQCSIECYKTGSITEIKNGKE